MFPLETMQTLSEVFPDAVDNKELFEVVMFSGPPCIWKLWKSVLGTTCVSFFSTTFVWNIFYPSINKLCLR
jgi:hypothetical protein